MLIIYPNSSYIVAGISYCSIRCFFFLCYLETTFWGMSFGNILCFSSILLTFITALLWPRLSGDFIVEAFSFYWAIRGSFCQGLWDVKQSSAEESCCHLRLYINVAFSRKLLWKGTAFYFMMKAIDQFQVFSTAKYLFLQHVVVISFEKERMQ